MSKAKDSSAIRGQVKLLLACGGLAFVWLVLLPWIARQPQVTQHIQQQEHLGIDPSAMFYSELEIVPAIAHRVERLELLAAPPK